MLYDIYTAMCQNSEREYYLQYITIKWDSKEKWYEVIDGQQRLTTLSLIIYILAVINSDFNNIAKDRVNYSRHNTSNIFDEVVELAYNSAEDDDNQITSQDTYYLVKAARCIKRFLALCQKYDKLKAFYDYLLDKVILIVNEESSFVSSEEVFMNLNDNKVPLTSTYLIKGLLLTLAARHDDNNRNTVNYKEIIDQRVIMGRQWDEISSWINQKEVAHFFFKRDEGGLDNFLKLVLNGIHNKGKDNHKTEESTDDLLVEFLATFEKTKKNTEEVELELFNEFNDAVKTPEDAVKCIKYIKHCYRRLRGIYEDNKLYNYLGYVLFCETISGFNKYDLSNVFYMSDVQLDKDLRNLILNAIPDLADTSLEQLRYSSHNPFLQNLLLSFSVFPEGENDKYRFDFVAYDCEKWSFEHISPQNPKTAVKIDKVAQSNIIQKIDNNPETKNKHELKEKILNGESIDPEQLNFLYDSDIDLDDMGNMALLSGPANSSLKNNPYIAKRSILFDMRNNGVFIPRHTIDIFNKIYHNDDEPQFNFDLTIWNQKDVDAHKQWMKKRNETIRKELSK